MMGALMLTAAALGAMANLHCLTMCGPLVAVGCHGGASRWSALTYLAGRTLSYGALGAAVGALSHPLMAGPLARELRIAVACLSAAWILAQAVKWMRPRGAPRLVRLRVQQRSSFMPRITRWLPRRGFGLGLVTALFPCGALMSATVAAAVTGSAGRGALFMVVFATASAPALVASVLLASRVTLLSRSVTGRARAWVGATLVTLAVTVAITPFYGVPALPCACHATH